MHSFRDRADCFECNAKQITTKQSRNGKILNVLGATPTRWLHVTSSTWLPFGTMGAVSAQIKRGIVCDGDQKVHHVVNVFADLSGSHIAALIVLICHNTIGDLEVLDKSGWKIFR